MSGTFTRAGMVLGLAAGLFLGCQQFTDQQDGGAAPTEGVTTDAAGTVDLRLAIKETEACRALRDQVLAADAAGEASVTLQTEFIRNCIEEVKASGATRDVIIPPGLIPDDRTRCRWLVTEIEGGREEMILKFRYYCPDDCDTLRAVDSVRHARLCRDPKPDCVELKARLAKTDPASVEYARLRRFLTEHCGTRDTILPPKDTTLTDCEILRKKLAGLDPASEEYARLRRVIGEKCVKTPVDTVRTSPCDSLKRRLSGMDPASTEYAHILALLKEGCGRPDTLVPAPRPCDSLKRLLATVAAGSPDYERILAVLREKCGRTDTVIKVPVPPTSCDSLKRRLSTLDPASPEYARVLAVLKEKCGQPDVGVKPMGFCDSLRLRMSKLDPAGDEYVQAKLLFSQKCMVVKDTTVVRDPLVSECESIRRKMASVDPASADYTLLKNLLVEKCGGR